MITVGRYYKDRADFINQMQLNLPGLGVRLNNRLYRVIGRVYDSASRGKFNASELAAIDQLKVETFDNWEEFCQFLYEYRLIAARVTGFVPHRPRNLGSRPPWIATINETRPPRQGLAIRHIVPSHLLGYAVENATGSVQGQFGKLLDAYGATYHRWKRGFMPGRDATLALFDGAKPPMQREPGTELMARRWAWSMLYNHPGNLWVGDADDNQVIGFMYAAAYGILKRLETMLAKMPDETSIVTSGSPMRSSSRKLPQRASESLQDAFRSLGSSTRSFREGTEDDLRDEIKIILKNVNDDLNEHSTTSISEMISFVEDVGANLEFDIPVLTDWEMAQDWRATFTQPGISVAQMVSFLKVDFSGTLADKRRPAEEGEKITDY